MHTQPMVKVEAIRRLWPLSSSFEYAAELGLSIRTQQPPWWSIFETAVDLQRYPLAQAQGFAFLRYLEEREPLVAREQLELVISAALLQCGPRIRRELEASDNCIGRNYQEIEDLAPLAQLEGEAVFLYRPDLCLGQPLGLTKELDTWSSKALAKAKVEIIETTPATIQQLKSTHDPRYLAGLFEFATLGGGLLTPETLVTEESKDAIYSGAGAVVAAAKDARRQRDRGLYLCQTHPGSHHAEHHRAGGSNLVNNLAVAAKDALKNGARSVAIVDLDAHHGQGTENIFYEDPSVFTFSLHQEPPFFPGTGERHEIGHGLARNSNLNLPLKPGERWITHLEEGLRQVKRRRPDLILVELSTDAHRADPVSDLQASDSDFYQAGKMLKALKAPIVYELGASLSERAWLGGVRSIIQGHYS